MLSKEYALALFQYGSELDKLNIFDEEFKIITDAIIGNDEIMKIISHPKVSVEEKKEILNNVLQNVDQDIKSFFYVLIDNGRFTQLTDIYSDFVNLLRESQNTMVIDLYSQVPLTNEKISELKNILENKYQKNIEIIATIDESVLGGVRLEFEGKVLDSTFKATLDDLKSNLM